MSQPDQAPEILYWTEARVVGGAYHLNKDGLRDVFAFMSGKDEKSAYAILARRGIGYVMICPWPGERRTGVVPRQEPLENRLAEGEAPPWLEPMPWPQATTSDLKLFRVVPGAAPP